MVSSNLTFFFPDQSLLELLFNITFLIEFGFQGSNCAILNQNLLFHWFNCHGKLVNLAFKIVSHGIKALLKIRNFAVFNSSEAFHFILEVSFSFLMHLDTDSYLLRVSLLSGSIFLIVFLLELTEHRSKIMAHLFLSLTILLIFLLLWVFEFSQFIRMILVDPLKFSLCFSC